MENTRLGKKKLDAGYSLNISLKQSQIIALVWGEIASKDLLENGIVVYLVLMSDDVTIEGFCILHNCNWAQSLGKKNLGSVEAYHWEIEEDHSTDNGGYC